MRVAYLVRRWRSTPLCLIAAVALLGLVPPVSAQPVPAVTEYYHLDALGSTRVVTSQTGAVLRHYEFGPFGGQDSQCTQSPDKRLFTGQVRDKETCLDYFGARHMRSTFGRFLTIDPVLDMEAALVDPQQWNRYAYARNNPMKFVDPDGREIAIKYGGRLINVGFDTSPVGEPNAAALSLIGAAATVGAIGPITLARGILQLAVACRLSPSCIDRATDLAEDAAGAAPRPGSRGFASDNLLRRHFGDHAQEWGGAITTSSDYVGRAQALLNSPARGDVLGAIRKNGDILRYNRRTNEFAVSASDGTLRTFFRPRDGLAYWLEEIRKIRPE